MSSRFRRGAFGRCPCLLANLQWSKNLLQRLHRVPRRLQAWISYPAFGQAVLLNLTDSALFLDSRCSRLMPCRRSLFLELLAPPSFFALASTSFSKGELSSRPNRDTWRRDQFRRTPAGATQFAWPVRVGPGRNSADNSTPISATIAPIGPSRARGITRASFSLSQDLRRDFQPRPSGKFL